MNYPYINARVMKHFVDALDRIAVDIARDPGAEIESARSIAEEAIRKASDSSKRDA